MFSVESCLCRDVLTTLVSHGLFPTSPHRPRVAISVDLLEFYPAFFQRACDSVTAFTGALKTFYLYRGYTHCNSKVHFLP